MVDDTELIQKLIEERDSARFVARMAHQFIQEGCFGDDIPYAETDTPEGELWIKKMVYQDAVSCNPWIKEWNGG